MQQLNDSQTLAWILANHPMMRYRATEELIFHLIFNPISNHQQFHREMTAACMQSSKSAASLTQEVEEMSTSVGMTNCKGLYSAVEGIMEGTMKVVIHVITMSYIKSVIIMINSYHAIINC